MPRKTDTPAPAPVVTEISAGDPEIDRICNDFITLYGINPGTAPGFTALLNYISSHHYTDPDDIPGLYKAFDIYVNLCGICGIIPTVYGFSVYSGISYDIFTGWLKDKDIYNGHIEDKKKTKTSTKSITSGQDDKLKIKDINSISQDTKKTVSTQGERVLNRLYTTNYDFASHILEVCKSAAVDTAGKQAGGGQFESKALYNITDQQQQAPSISDSTIYVTAPVSRQAIAAEFGIELPENANKKKK